MAKQKAKIESIYKDIPTSSLRAMLDLKGIEGYKLLIESLKHTKEVSKYYILTLNPTDMNGNFSHNDILRLGKMKGKIELVDYIENLLDNLEEELKNRKVDKIE